MKRLLSIVALVGLALPSFGYDFGINLSEIPVVTGGETQLYAQSSQVDGYLTASVYGGTLDFAAYGTYLTQTSSLSSPWTAAKYQDFNLSTASFSEISPSEQGVVQWSIGRRAISDSTGGWINSSTWDGANWNQTIGSFHWGLSTGYSGLQPKLSSKVSGSPFDVTDYSDDSVFWAPNRIYASALAGWTEAYLRQDVQIEAIGDYDLRSSPNALNGVYLVASMGGPLPWGVREQSFFAVSYNNGSYTYSNGSSGGAMMLGTELSLNVPSISGRVAWSAVGTRGFNSWYFQPIAGTQMGDVISMPTYNSAMTSLSANTRPFSTLSVGGKLSGLFRTGTSDLLLSGYNVATSEILVGGEASVNLSWTPTSDFVLGGTVGVFLPYSPAFISGTKPTYLGAAVVTLKL